MKINENEDENLQEDIEEMAETAKNNEEENATPENTEVTEPEEKDISDMSHAELEQEIIELQKDNDKYYKHLQRTAAEFDNYKKRVSKEKDAIYNLAVGDTVAKYVNVLDNIDRALAIETTDDKMKEGISLIKKQMLDIMTSLGCVEIPTVGETFNPEVHDAVMHIESEEYGEQQIVEELRKGYKCGDRVIRHAMVKVAN